MRNELKEETNQMLDKINEQIASMTTSAGVSPTKSPIGNYGMSRMHGMGQMSGFEPSYFEEGVEGLVRNSKEELEGEPLDEVRSHVNDLKDSMDIVEVKEAIRNLKNTLIESGNRRSTEVGNVLKPIMSSIRLIESIVEEYQES